MFTKIPAEIGKLQHLTYLSLENNAFTSTPLLKELANLTMLYYLYLPLRTALFRFVTVLDWIRSLNNNSINGTIPVEIGGMVGLQYLYLRNNNLSGSVPYSLGNIPRLSVLCEICEKNFSL